jgi:hypothetical protein
MKVTTTRILIFLGLIMLAMLACLPLALLGLRAQAPSTPPAPQFQATVSAILTQTAAAQPTQVPPTAAPSQIPTATSIPPTSTQVPTATPISYCYWVQFIKDVTIPDGTVVAAGDTFTKTWRLKNIGTCAWTTDTRIVYVSGAQMSGPVAAALPGYVAPGQTVDVSVSLTAPFKAGDYVGYWMLRGPDGTYFGSGSQAEIAFFVDVSVEDELLSGTVTGNICYPSEFNPDLILYFEKVRTGETIQFSIPKNHPEFTVSLPPGRYYAYAWTPEYQLEGAYVNRDRTMRSFVVRRGELTDGIAICDWDVKHHERGE